MSSVAHASRLVELLGLTVQPVAVMFSATPPAGVARVASAAPSGCSYWKHAADGQVFHTLAEDHFGCAVGAYTHGAELGDAQKKELEGLVTTMVGLEYVTMAEVSGSPTRKEKLAVVSYAPLATAPFAPDLVLVRATARAAMLFAEAAHAEGLQDPGAAGLRPACTMIPRVLDSGRATNSLGCIGNRVYTGLPDGEVWASAPGGSIDAIVTRLETVARANIELEKFHRARLGAST